jgi:hypothetical protein
MEFGFRSRPVVGWAAFPGLDDPRRVHAGKPGHRSRATVEGGDVVAALNQICGRRGVPKILFCDNGSEFTSQIMDLWAFTTACRSTSRGRGSQPITRT